MTAPFPGWELRVWLAVGVGLAVFAWVAEHRERKAHDKELREQKTEMAGLRKRLETGQAYQAGKMDTLAQLSGKSIEMLAKRTGTDPRDTAEFIANAAAAKIDQLTSEIRKIRAWPLGNTLPSLEEHKLRIEHGQTMFLDQWKVYETISPLDRPMSDTFAQIAGKPTAGEELQRLKRGLMAEAAQLRTLLDFDFEG